jgi:SM-20-related protein
MEAAPILSPALDVSGIAEAYRRNRRVHIPRILTEESAIRVHRCLEQETPFALLTKGASGGAELWPAATQQREAELMTKAFSQARDGFHYFYDAHNLSKQGEPYADPGHCLAAVTQFLNGMPMLDFARAVTGNPAVAFASAQATRYRAGHFLNHHDDSNEPGRIAAYVLNLTPHWRADWGGALLFLDGPGRVAEGYLPTFNALNLFAVPQDHFVGFVSPFAGASRYSITGWFTAR